MVETTNYCFFLFFFQTARAAISGLEGAGAAGVPIPEKISSPSNTLPITGPGHVLGTASRDKQTPATRLFVGEEAVLAEGIGAEIEEALGLVLEQVRVDEGTCVH